MYSGQVVETTTEKYGKLQLLGFCCSVFGKAEEFRAAYIFEDGSYEEMSLGDVNENIHLLGHNNDLENYAFQSKEKTQEDFKLDYFSDIFIKKQFDRYNYES
jgi:hypothetical protein